MCFHISLLYSWKMLRSYVLGLLFLREVACKTTSVDPAVASGESTVTGTAILRSTDANNLDAATITSAAAFERADWNIWRTTCWVSKACTVYCEADDRACWETASSIIQTCAPSWSSSIAVLSESSAPGGTEWTSYLTTMGWSGVPESTTLSIYTSFSTANETFRKQGLSSEPYTTITPVYAIGPPIESVSVTNMSDGPATTYRTAPTPGCKFGAVSTWNSSYCGGCTITGGTVELYYWPASTAILGGDEQIASTTMTAELNGTVLQSPSVYIYLHTIYAKDACGTVGRPHFGSIIAMNAEEISTIVHIGGKVAAYETGALDYGILTGSLPPASDYQMLPTCIMFGCKTMLPTVWSPTLVVPSKLRTVDTSWAHCEMHLAGL